MVDSQCKQLVHNTHFSSDINKKFEEASRLFLYMESLLIVFFLNVLDPDILFTCSCSKLFQAIINAVTPHHHQDGHIICFGWYRRCNRSTNCL